jgi:hypothetical protein
MAEGFARAAAVEDAVGVEQVADSGAVESGPAVFADLEGTLDREGEADVGATLRDLNLRGAHSKAEQARSGESTRSEVGLETSPPRRGYVYRSDHRRKRFAEFVGVRGPVRLQAHWVLVLSISGRRRLPRFGWHRRKTLH